MPRTRTAFASKAFTDKPWTLGRMCRWALGGGTILAAILALLFVLMG